MRKILLLLIIICFVQCSRAQQWDVFHNKQYRTAYRLFKDSLGPGHLPADIEILQDINESAADNWEPVESRLRTEALKYVHAEFSYLKMESRIKKQIGQINEALYVKGEDPYGTAGYKPDPKLKSIEIRLISIVNGHGIYRTDYNFKAADGRGSNTAFFSWQNYYLADFANNRIKMLDTDFTELQKNKLRQIALPKIYRLYLLGTQKIDVANIDAVQNVPEKVPESFAQAIDFSKAHVLPFFSNLLVEFSAQSPAIKLFDGEAFRVLLSEHEQKELLPLFPEYRAVFSRKMQTSTPGLRQQLDKDANFDLGRMSRAPKGLKALELLPAYQNLRSLDVINYSIRNKGEVLSSTESFVFDQQGKLTQIEQQDDKDKIIFEERYHYDAGGRLSFVRTRSHSALELKVQHYDKAGLSYIESIRIHEKNYRQSEGTDISLEQELFAYNNNYRHSKRVSMIGDLYPRGMDYATYHRSVAPGQWCNDHFCYLLNDKQQVIGVRNKKYSQIDIAFNADGKPLENYMDNDREQCFFHYDDKGRLQHFEYFNAGELRNDVYYEYQNKPGSPLTITDPTTLIRQEYQVIFWE